MLLTSLFDRMHLAVVKAKFHGTKLNRQDDFIQGYCNRGERPKIKSELTSFKQRAG